MPEDKDPTRRIYRQSSAKDIAPTAGTLDICEPIPLNSQLERTFERPRHYRPAKTGGTDLR